MTSQMRKTVLHDKHLVLGAKMVDFAGWQMPLHYPTGILSEHLQTRKTSGLFDVSHMGRFIFRSSRALDFLQHVLTNNAAALHVGRAQYTMIPNDTGGAIDDAYLYRFGEDEYLLVVNAANRKKGLPELARLCADKAAHARQRLLEIPGVKAPFPDTCFFNEFVIELPSSAQQLTARLLEKQIIPGLPLGRYYPDMDRSLLIAVTEKRSKNQIDALARALEEGL